jgi:hypothetical protein
VDQAPQSLLNAGSLSLPKAMHCATVFAVCSCTVIIFPNAFGL